MIKGISSDGDFFLGLTDEDLMRLTNKAACIVRAKELGLNRDIIVCHLDDNQVPEAGEVMIMDLDDRKENPA